MATFSLCLDYFSMAEFKSNGKSMIAQDQAVAWLLVTVLSQIYSEKEQQGKKSVQSGEERRGAGSDLVQIWWSEQSRCLLNATGEKPKVLP